MRYVTEDQFLRDLTSWENIHNTRINMRIEGRNPTIMELRSNYLRENIVVQTDNRNFFQPQNPLLQALK